MDALLNATSQPVRVTECNRGYEIAPKSLNGILPSRPRPGADAIGDACATGEAPAMPTAVLAGPIDMPGREIAEPMVDARGRASYPRIEAR